MFILENDKEQSQYKQLPHHVDENMIELANDVIYHIEKKWDTAERTYSCRPD